MAIIGIVAVAQNFAIGRGGKLPWHYSSDLKFFKETTTGNAIIMGRKTFASIGKPLPNRLNLVLSRSSSVLSPRVISLQTTEAARELSKYVANDLYVIGGASIYEAFSGFIDKWIVTEIPEFIPDADVYMPEDFLQQFILTTSRVLDDDLTVKFYSKKL